MTRCIKKSSGIGIKMFKHISVVLNHRQLIALKVWSVCYFLFLFFVLKNGLNW